MSDQQTQYNSTRESNLKVYAFLAITGLMTLCVLSITSSYQTLGKEIQAGLAISLPVTLVALFGFTAIGLCAVAIALIAWLRRPQDNSIATTVRTITAREKPAPQLTPLQPQYQLPTPILADVPVMTYRGKRIPFGLMGHEQELDQASEEQRVISEPEPTVDRNTVILRTRTESGQTIDLGAKLLLRFASCPTPDRSEWTGDKKYYGLAMKFAEAHGLLEKAGNGYKWRDGYPQETRVSWVNQLIDFALKITPSPTPEDQNE